VHSTVVEELRARVQLRVSNERHKLEAELAQSEATSVRPQQSIRARRAWGR
jgi:hypothetical protein